MSGYGSNDRNTKYKPQSEMYKRGYPDGTAHGWLFVEHLPPDPNNWKYQYNSSNNDGQILDIGKWLIEYICPEKPN